jgi:hypothetical protein
MTRGGSGCQVTWDECGWLINEVEFLFTFVWYQRHHPRVAKLVLFLVYASIPTECEKKCDNADNVLIIKPKIVR